MNLTNIVEDAFSIYAAATIQNRALIDVRDAIKPSARMCFYAQKLEKIDSKHPIQPSPTSTGAAIKHFYTHGNASCYSLLARYGKEYVSRYPLEDFHGSTGSLIASGSEAAERYTKMRLNSLGDRLFNTLEKDTIDTWFDNFSNTEKYPSVLPSLGYYNIVNGTIGIATAVSSSIPSFNLIEVNNAMIKLLWDRNIDFDKIYCAPDFVGGATIINADQVKESLKNGVGKACCIRSTVEYDENENCLIVSEIPYGVYTNTICKELIDLVEQNPSIGIKKVLDLTGKKPKIKIFLNKNINPNSLIKKLYKETSLQSYFSINMTMLDNGTKPKVFGWREALLAHIDHETEVRTKAHLYDIKKITQRLHIIEGFLIAIANIEEVIQIIRSSNNKQEAENKLIERFSYSNEQATAILKLTLSKLTHLELQSYKDEKDKLIKELNYHQNVLDDRNILYKEMENDFKCVAIEYGDSRRTKCINLNFDSEDEDAEPIEKKELLIHFTNLGNIYTQESTTLMTTRRGTHGKNVKMANNETIIKTINDDNFSSLLAFTNKGKMYTLNTDDLPVSAKINVAQLFDMESGEHVTTLTTLAKRNEVEYFTFVTKNGMIKKTKASEYIHRRGKSLKAINLKDDDEVISVHFINTEPVGLLTSEGNFVIISTEEINSIGRATAGVKAIKLGINDTVIASHIVCPSDTSLITVTAHGITKKANMEEFPLSNRGIKGKQISGTKENDRVVNFLTISSDCDIIIIGSKEVTKFNTSELRTLSRTAVGVTGLKIKDGSTVVDIVRG